LTQARDNRKCGKDWISGDIAKVPKVTVYTGGFECQDPFFEFRMRCVLQTSTINHHQAFIQTQQDLSSMNTAPKKLDLNITESCRTQKLSNLILMILTSDF
jgi:hypothetical protein